MVDLLDVTASSAGSSAVATPGVAPGAVLAGKYRVERVLGAGGMGVVVAAMHIQLEDRVAIKFLLPEALNNADAVARFDREARAAVRIKSEHVARVSDVGRLENGAPYMVMEYLDGEDLAAWVEKRGSMPVEQAVEFILQACEAIAEAHALGIVHRDLKPANLFCVRRADGLLSVKVLDFGISKVTASADRKDMTRTTAVMGSPFYMSPEQIRSSKGVDSRSDIWSLGVILFEILTGRVPFSADTITELAVIVVNDPSPSIRGLRPELPVEIENVVSRCLEKDRDRRFQNVGELAVALQPFAPARAAVSVERTLRTVGLGVPEPSPPLAAAPGGTIPSPSGPALLANQAAASEALAATAAAWDQTGPTRRGNRALVPIAAGVLVALLVGVVVGRRTFAPSASTGVPAALPTPAVVPIAPSSAGRAEPVASAAPPSTQPAAGASSAPVGSAPTKGPGLARASSSPTSSATPGPRPVVTVAPTPTARPPAPDPTPKANCNPAYTLDAEGHRQYKPECL